MENQGDFVVGQTEVLKLGWVDGNAYLGFWKIIDEKFYIEIM